MHIGILGGGQLARMLALAAYPLGFKLSCIDPTPDPCASEIISCIQAPYTDLAAIDKLLQQCDIITYENENIPLETAEYINQHKPLHPSPTILHHTQDRLLEKQFLQQLRIATAPFMPIDNTQMLAAVISKLGLPLVLKTRRFGYDGKGQQIVNTAEQLSLAWQQLSAKAAVIAEGFIPFQQELSLIAVRNKSQIAFYPLTANLHRDGILRISKAPFQDPQLQQHAQEIAHKILNHADYIGILAIEFFRHNDTLLVNELAPRVHNSGHWTIEGAITSQFENHLRAIANLPLGDPGAKGFSAMFNCIGSMPKLEKVLAIQATHVHDYHKQPRELRKVGHVTLNTMDKQIFEQSLSQLEDLED